MWVLLTPAQFVVLGPVLGLLLAKFIPDETQWYPKYFLAASTVFLLAALLFLDALLIGVLLALVGVYGLIRRQAIVLAATVGAAAALSTNLIGIQLLAIALIPGAGYFVHYKQDKQLWWFLLVPIIITASTLL